MAVGANAQITSSTKVNPVPQLLKNLDSLDEHISANAARSLGIVYKSKDTGREQLQTSVEKLIEKMNASKWTRVRIECIRSLGEIRAAGAVEPIQEILQNENMSIATAAADALSQILHVDAARALFKQAGSDATEHVRRVAYGAMVNLATQDDVDFLVAGIDSDNWRIQVDALRGLERATGAGARLSGEVYGKMASVLGNEIANVSDAAINALIRTRSAESINTLIAAADTTDTGVTGDTSWRVRANALRAINRIGFPGNERALPAVIRQMNDRTGNVTREVSKALAQIRSAHHYFRSTPEQVRPIADRYLYPKFLAELEKADSPALRSKIIDQMGTARVSRNYAARVADVAAKSLDKAIAHTDGTQLRNQSLELLGSSGSTGVDAALITSLTALQKALENAGDKTTADPTWRVRSRALQALRRIDYPRNRTLIPHVIRQLDDKTANVLKEARSNLQRVRQHD
ncbi:MAG: HEAT repeat domain-containing protein, partial [Verrucomicrobiota bacterium]